MTDRSVRYNFIGNFSSLSAGLSQASRQTKDFASSLTALDARGARMRSGLTQVGQTAGRASLLIGAGLTAAAKAAIDWESAWAGVVKTVDGSSAQLQQLEGDLREMARTLPATHTEIAAVAEAAGQLGVATPDVAEFTRTMIMLGETTNLSADEAATSIARLTNVMGTAPDDVDNLGAALVDLGNNSATTEAEILTLGQRLSAAGSIAGLSESDVLGFAATLSSVGVEAEAGGTALSKVFTTVRDASIDGGEKLETFAKVAGVSAEQFRAAFEDDAAGAIAMFIEGLGKINDAGGSTSQVFKDLGLTDQRLSRALLSTASAGDLLGESLTRSAQAFEDNSALTAEFDKRLETTAAQVQISWNNIKDAGIDAGAAILPVVEQTAEAVSGLAQAFGNLPGPVQKSLTGLAGITAVLGGGLWFTSKIVNGVASTSQALQDLGVNAGKAQGAIRGVVKAGAGLATVVVTANLLQQAFEKIADTRIDGGTLFRDLEALADDRPTANLENLYSIFTDIDDKWQRNANPLSWISSWDPSGFEAARDSVEELDQSLAALVEAGQSDMAAAAFEKISATAKDAGRSTEEITKLFPEYGTALDNTAAAADSAAESTASLVSPARQAADANRELQKAMREANAELSERVGLALEAFDAETAWRRAMKEATAQSKKNKAGIEGNSEAALNNREALSRLAGAWNNQSDAVKRNEGRQKAARQKFLEVADAMGIAEGKAKRLADRYLDMPSKVDTKITADTSQAIVAVADFKARLDSLRNKTITVTQFNAYKGGPQLQQADGGTVPGQLQPYGDRVHALLAPGEEVISNRHGQADRHRSLLKQINANRLADGGTAMAAGMSAYRRAQQRAAGHGGAMTVRMGDLRVSGTLNTPWGPAQVEGVARAAARDEISADREFDHMLEEARR